MDWRDAFIGFLGLAGLIQSQLLVHALKKIKDYEKEKHPEKVES